MLGWGLTSLIVAAIAGIFGFGGVAAASNELARMFFFVFLAGFLVALLVHLVRRLKAPHVS